PPPPPQTPPPPPPFQAGQQESASKDKDQVQLVEELAKQMAADEAKTEKALEEDRQRVDQQIAQIQADSKAQTDALIAQTQIQLQQLQGAAKLNPNEGEPQQENRP